MNRFGRFAVAAAAAMMMAAPALACSPMPFPPPPPAAAGTSDADVAALSLAWNRAHAVARAEEDRVWKLRQQTALFDAAKSLVIVRYDRGGKTGKGDDAETAAVLKPVRWVKGSGASDELQLGMGDLPPCGQMVGHDAYYGKPGDVFVVYLSGNKLQQQDVLEAMSIERIMEPRTLAALTAQ